MKLSREQRERMIKKFENYLVLLEQTPQIHLSPAEMAEFTQNEYDTVRAIWKEIAEIKEEIAKLKKGE